MFVTAISTPRYDGWLWRIVNYDGAMLEESPVTFPTIDAALVDGRLRLQQMDRPPLSGHVSSYRSRWYRRPR